MAKKPILLLLVAGMLIAAAVWILLSPQESAEIRQRDRRLLRLEAAGDREIDDAVRQIGNMVAESPNDPLLHSARAKIHLRRAEIANDPRNLVLGLDAAETAIELDPHLAKAWFHKAEALGELGLRQEGVIAWDEYIFLEKDAGKRQEAAQRKMGLFASGASFPQEIENEILRIVRTGGNVEELARRELAVAQAVAIEKIPALLGDAIVAGRSQEAEGWLAALRSIGDAAQEIGGDPYLGDVAARLNAGKDLEMGRALIALGKGMELYEQRKTVAAAPLLESALLVFEARGQAISFWARMVLAGCAYIKTAPTFEQDIEELAAQAKARGYKAVEGHALWLQGLYLVSTTRVDEGYRRYRRATELFRVTSWKEPEGFLRFLLCEAEMLRGSKLEAWRELHFSMRNTASFSKIRRLEAIWRTAARFANEISAPKAARILVDRAVSDGWRSKHPIALAEALQARVGLGAAVQAARTRADFETMGRLLEKLPAEDLRTRGLLFLARARFLPGRSLAERLEELEQGIMVHRRTHTLNLLPALLRLRAGSRLEMGEKVAAGFDLEEAAQLLEDQKLGELSLEQRANLLEVARGVYEEWIRLCLAENRPPIESLVVFERFAAFLQERKKPVDVLPEALPPGVAVVTYFSLPDRLLTWVTKRDGVSLSVADLERVDLQNRLRRLLDSLEGSSLGSFERAEKEVSRLLVAPVAERFAGSPRLFFEIDPYIGSLPAAALKTADGRLLIERHSVAILHRWPDVLADIKPGSRSTALVVGDPDFDRAEYAAEGFKDLSGAADEARLVAQIYPRSQLLLHEKPTPEAFLAAFRDGPDVLHLASHLAWRNRAANMPELVLAKGAAGSALSAERVRQAVAVRAPELVYLAACDSAVRGARAGARLPSMAEVFLDRGATAVVGSTIRLADSRNVDFAAEFHRRYRSGGRPEQILRDIQLNRISESSEQGPPWWCALQVQTETIFVE